MTSATGGEEGAAACTAASQAALAPSAAWTAARLRVREQNAHHIYGPNHGFASVNGTPIPSWNLWFYVIRVKYEADVASRGYGADWIAKTWGYEQELPAILDEYEAVKRDQVHYLQVRLELEECTYNPIAGHEPMQHL